MVDIVFVDILAMIAVPIQLFFFLLYFIRFRREPITPRGRVLTTLTFVFVLAHHLVLVASIGYKDRIISCWPVFITSSLYANIWCLPYCLRAVVVYYKHLHNHHAMCVSRLSMLRDAQTSSLHSDFPSSVGPTSPGKESHGGGDGHIGGRRSRKKSPLVKQNSGFRNLLNPWGPSRSQQQQQQQQQQQHSRQEAHPMKTMGSAQATLPADSHAQVPPSPGGMDTCATPEPLTDTSSSLSMDATSSSSTSPSQPALAGASSRLSLAEVAALQDGSTVNIYKLKQELAQELNEAITFRKTYRFAVIKWLQTSRNQAILFTVANLVSLGLMLTALFLTIDVSFSDFDTSLDTCIYGAMYVVILEIIIFVPLIAGCVFLVWSSRDVYRIKQELLINTSTSFVLAVLWGTAAVSGAAGWFRADIIAIFLTAFNNLLIVIFPVVLSYLPFYKRLTRNRMHLNPDIEGHLESGRSKTGLFDFETFRHFPGPAMHFEHFCIESWCAEIHLFHTRSLRFLDNYKRMTPMQRYDEVLDMRDQFIMTNSPFEINIPGHVRQKLLQTFKEVADLDENGKPRDIPRDIFLPAHRETGEQLDRLLNIWRDTPIGQRETRDLPLM